jgi:hypothetical protein
MEEPCSVTMRSLPWRISYGEREAVQKAHRRKTGSMPLNNCDPVDKSIAGSVGEEDCPKCGTATEPVDVEVEGLPIEHLRLCPQCYLVTWNDETGFHSRQGVPMKEGFNPDSNPLGESPLTTRRAPPEC